MWYDKYNIRLPNNKNSGEVQTTCPKCSHTRKKKLDKCLSVNLSTQVFICHHCGWSGGEPMQKEYIPKPKEYVKPVWSNKTQLSDKLVKWFESRGIRQKTLTDARITEGLEFMPQTGKEANTVQFNYFLNGELINVKYRTADKNFKLHKDSKLIPYNADCLFNKEFERVIIVEGEMDCLSLLEAGIKDVISVPNGANKKTNNLEYLNDFIEQFDEKVEIILAVDNDEAGRNLRNELAFRLGIDKCKYIDFKEFKDFNEVLIVKGISGVHEYLSYAVEFPLEGVYRVSDFENELFDLKSNGLQQGAKIGILEFDSLLTFERGYITTITGIPGHGKSDFVDQIVLGLAVNEGWKTAYFSPENKPTQVHISKLIRKVSAKHFNDVSHYDIKMIVSWLNEYVSFIQPEADYSLDSILEKVKSNKKRFGLDAFVIDAWNKLEHQYDKGESETKHIGKSLDKLALFCQKNNLHCFLIAHPTKMNKDKATGQMERPNLYSISGSSNFYNKSDNGIVVYRDFVNDTVDVDVLKVKFQHWGETGRFTPKYDKRSGRYYTTFNFDSWISYKQEQLPVYKAMQPNNEFEIKLDESAPDWMKDDLPY